MLNDSKWFRQSQLFNTRSEHSCVTGPRPSTTRPHHTGAKGVALATIEFHIKYIVCLLRHMVHIGQCASCLTNTVTPTSVIQQHPHRSPIGQLRMVPSASCPYQARWAWFLLCRTSNTERSARHHPQTSPTLHTLKWHWKLVMLT